MNIATYDIALWPNDGNGIYASCFHTEPSNHPNPTGSAQHEIHGLTSRQVWAARKAQVSFDDFGKACPSLSWLHSVVHERDFVDGWTAQDTAFHLAAEVSFNFCIRTVSDGCQNFPEFGRTSTSAPKHRKVSFAEVVDVLIGIEGELHFHQIQIPHESLRTGKKPWTLKRVGSEVTQTNVSFLSNAVASSFQFEVIEPVNVSANESLYVRQIRKSPQCMGTSFFTGMAPRWPQSIKVSHVQHFAASRTQRLEPKNVVQPTDPIYKSCESGAQIGHSGPTSQVPSLLHVRQLHAPTKQLHPFFRVRRDFESPVAWVPDAQEPDEEQDHDDDMELHNHHVPPAFVHDLAHRLARLGFDPEDNDFDIPVRTWYLDHQTVRRWTAPRVLQLVGPPPGWEMHFSSLWIDQIDPDERFDLTIINPDPPRSASQRHFVLDLVITQSLALPRVAGLVTIIPEDSDSFDFFSVACSFEEHISGFDILT